MQLASLGWRPFFADQLAANEATAALRVMGIHRSGLVLSDGVRDVRIRLGRLWYRQAPENRPAVGDWVLTDQHRSKIERFLKRQNVLRRMASGAKADVQLIGANIDTLMIVSSCNAEFSMARLQRYLTVAADAEIEPLIVLTKADLATSAERYGQRAREAGGGVAVEVVNALDAAMLGGIRARLQPACTVALLGSSGVGKTTLLNTLAGAELGATRAIRESDAKGRHTTTQRLLHRLPDGSLVLDGPGVREFGVAVGAGDLVPGTKRRLTRGAGAAVVPRTAGGHWGAYIEALAGGCRFADCRHDTEPGCAIQTAIAEGRLQRRQVDGYLKLRDERNRHATSLAARDRRDQRDRRRQRRGEPTDDED